MSNYRVLSPILHDQVRYEPDSVIDGDKLSDGQAEALIRVGVLEAIEGEVTESAEPAAEPVVDSLPAAEPVSAPDAPTEPVEAAETAEAAPEPAEQPETTESSVEPVEAPEEAPAETAEPEA